MATRSATALTATDLPAAALSAFDPPDHEDDSLDRKAFLTKLLLAQATQEFPLSSAQQRLWVLEQLRPGTAAYNISVGLRIRGPLDVEALQRSVQAVEQRHEILRTTIAATDGQPRQVVSPSAKVDLPLHDVAGANGIGTSTDDECEQRAADLIQLEIARPFDLSRGPLFRCFLVRLGSQEHIFVCTMHHIVSDNWSMELFVDELTDTYDALVARRTPSPRPLPMQYGDFAEWQRELDRDHQSEDQLRYWTEMLADAPAVSTLPTDRPRPAQQSFVGASYTFGLPGDLYARLRDLAQREDVTPFMLLLAAFQILLHRHSGQTDILIGVPVAGRTLPEVERLIGFFVNTVVVRTGLSGNPRFTDVLRQTRGAFLDALAHQNVPFERVVDAVCPTRNPSYSPLFQVMFAQVKAAVHSRDLGAAKVTPYVINAPTSRFDLGVNLIEDERGNWWVQIEYNSDLFDQAHIAKVSQDYHGLIERIVGDCNQRLSQLLGQMRPDDPQALASTSVTQQQPRWIAPRRRTRSSAASEFVAPQDAVEVELARIWQAALQISPIGMTEDFFDLGGNSLAAIGIISKVRRVFGVALPVSTLFADPTIAYMAKLLRDGTQMTSSLVPLCWTGSRTPLFAAGSNHRYRELSRALGPDQPFYKMDVYGLHERRRLAGQPPLTTIEQTAAQFVKDILAIQPSGPYCIAGQCEGGIVAIEIARQLQARGANIACLMQFDTPVRGYFKKLHWTRRVLASVARGELTGKLIDFIHRRRPLTIPLELQEQQHLHLLEVIWNGVYAYAPGMTFDGDVTLLRATETYGIYEDVATGWDRVATSLHVHDVPGNHLRFFSRPESQHIVADILQSAQRATT